ncbi:MAG: hypothetical protein H0W19_08350 [Nitrosopumilus sp.]|nr:hypothetical protein [Nitrosopumilus sp.]
MYYNKLTSGFISAIFLLLVISSANFSSIKLVNAATGDLVNYNNNFQTYTSPNDPNKDSAMQNADCVVNFMTSYVYTSSSAENCNNSGTATGSSSPSVSPAAPSSQSQGLPSTDGPQTGVTDGSGVGVVRVVDMNSNAGGYTPAQSSSFVTTNSNPSDTNNVNVNVNDDNNDNDKDVKDKDNDDDNNDNDKDAKDKDNDDDNNDNDKDAKVYNESTVTKEERKLLLTTCFERAYEKGDYLSTGEIEKCAKNYNS